MKYKGKGPLVLALTIVGAVAWLAVLAETIGAQTPVRSPIVPRVVIVSAADTVPKFDTLYRVTATPFSTNGQRSGTSKITWKASPAGVVSIATADKYGQAVNIGGLAVGSAWVYATWTRTTAPKGTFRDSLLIRVRHARVTSLALFSALDSLRRPVWRDSLELGKMRCVFAIARDRRGQPITGVAVSFRSANSAVATTGPGPTCPDTTVDPLDLAFPGPDQPFGLEAPAARRPPLGRKGRA